MISRPRSTERSGGFRKHERASYVGRYGTPVSIAWWKRPDLAIFVDYGQKPAAAERDAGAAACGAMDIPHKTVWADCSALGSGDMAGSTPSPQAPVPEWWPFRNQLILTLAGMAALRLGAKQLMIGTLSTDGMHADGLPEFVERASMT